MNKSDSRLLSGFSKFYEFSTDLCFFLLICGFGTSLKIFENIFIVSNFSISIKTFSFTEFFIFFHVYLHVRILVSIHVNKHFRIQSFLKYKAQISMKQFNLKEKNFLRIHPTQKRQLNFFKITIQN